MNRTIIAVSTTTASPVGAQIVHTSPQRTRLGTWARRASRTATLDGGSVVVDGGFSHTDRTVEVDLTDQPADTVAAFRYICESFDTVILMTADGAYAATPEKVIEAAGIVTATFMISGEAAIK